MKILLKLLGILAFCAVFYGGIYFVLRCADSAYEQRAKISGYYCKDKALVNPRDYKSCGFNKGDKNYGIQN
jgi:hypothetical protein